VFKSQFTIIQYVVIHRELRFIVMKYLRGANRCARSDDAARNV